VKSLQRELIARVVLLVWVVICVVPQAIGADFQKGFDAVVKGDYTTALEEFKPLAEQGYTSAQYNLSLMYYKGEGVPQNYKKAVKWFRKAAEQGHTSAQYSLAWMFDRGKEVPQDYKEAVKWYTKAAEQGHAEAQYSLAWMYYDGEGVPQNFVHCYVWNSLAAASGHKTAIINRVIVAKRLSSQQLAEAQQLAAKIQYEIDNKNASPNQ
jgi:TPR repeat protein